MPSAGRPGAAVVERRRHVRVAAAGGAVRGRLPGDGDALDAGRLHGQSAEVLGQGAHADQQADR